MAEITSDIVRVDTEGQVAVIRIDRPKLNPLDVAVQEALARAAAQVAVDDEVAAVVLTGGEKVFAAGADIAEMQQMTHAQMVARAPRLQACLTAIAEIPKPVVAAVNGYALGGGCELALCADIRIAGESAVFGQPEIKLGVIPGAGGTQRLARLIGPSRAKELIFSGRFVPADEALRIGLVDRVVPDDQVQAEARTWAAQFADGPRLALRAAKCAVDRGLGTDLSTGLALESQEFASLFATEDRAIGMESFLADGPGRARFVGR